MNKRDPKRYMTKCSDCGDTLENIDLPRKQICRCGKVTAHDGIVEDQGRVKVKLDKQATMFETHTEYPG